MCPDRELLSAYFDGEVPSPWRERIARHLESCAACTRTLERYSGLAATLQDRSSRSDASQGDASLPDAPQAAAARGDSAETAEALLRVRSRLAARFGRIFSQSSPGGAPEGAAGGEEAAGIAGPASKQGGLSGLWSRELKVRLPVAAAAALVIAALAAFASVLYLRPEREALRALAATEIAPSSQSASFEEILRYLESQDAQATLTIRLPSNATFDAPGQPVIMRTDAYPPAQKGTKP
jgi:anti-sigma factor RsiW